VAACAAGVVRMRVETSETAVIRVLTDEERIVPPCVVESFLLGCSAVSAEDA
jgi:hypothetical protein